MKLSLEYAGKRYFLSTDGYYRTSGINPKALHEQKWIDKHGPIPEGHIVAHLGNRNDNDVSNLVCGPRKQLAHLIERRRGIKPL